MPENGTYFTKTLFLTEKHLAIKLLFDPSKWDFCLGWRIDEVRNYYIQKFEKQLSGHMKEDENSNFTRGARNELQAYLEFAEKLKKVMETESR